MSTAFGDNLQVLLESFSVICEMNQTLMAYYQEETRGRFQTRGTSNSLARHGAPCNVQSQWLAPSSGTHYKHGDAGSTCSLNPQTHVPTLATSCCHSHHTTKEECRHVPRGNIPVTPWFFCSPPELWIPTTGFQHLRHRHQLRRHACRCKRHRVMLRMRHSSMTMKHLLK